MRAIHSPVLRPILAVAFALCTMALLTGLVVEHSVATDLDEVAEDPAPHVDKWSAGVAQVITLPDGFQPEGIATGRGSTFFVGSLADGSIYRGDLRTGEGEVLVTPQEERVAVGLTYDQRSNYLFVAGGNSGEAYVYDADTGEEAAAVQLTEGGEGTFINDVIVTRTAAYFTNSFQQEIYRVPLTRSGDMGDEVETLPLSGDYESVDGFNTNGIEATPSGEHLIVVNSSTGTLYRVDPESGEATTIELGGDSVPAGDGILLDGRTLYVVQNQHNQIAAVQLSPDFSSGEVTGTITSEHFDVPTTVAAFGNDLYAVNARFGTAVTPTTEYSVVRVAKR